MILLVYFLICMNRWVEFHLVLDLDCLFSFVCCLITVNEDVNLL